MIVAQYVYRFQVIKTFRVVYFCNHATLREATFFLFDLFGE
jgi:hypothetical protein